MSVESISVVVPTLDEGPRIVAFLETLRAGRPLEIIVVDGGSGDATVSLARKHADRALHEERGLAEQLNCGAVTARGEILFFPYVDTLLPDNWVSAIHRCFAASDVVGGAFRLAFDSPRPCFRWIAGTANLRTHMRVGPLGDQAIFVLRDVFHELGGYRSACLLEDLDLVARLRRCGRVVIAPERVHSSVRRWERGGILATALRNWCYLGFHLLGIGGENLRRSYRSYRARSH